MTFLELYQIFFDACVGHPSAQVIAQHCRSWKQLDDIFNPEDYSLYGLIEGSITTFSGMTFPVYTVGIISESYVSIKDEYLDNNVAFLCLTVNCDFKEKREILWCCDNQEVALEV